MVSLVQLIQFWTLTQQHKAPLYFLFWWNLIWLTPLPTGRRTIQRPHTNELVHVQFSVCSTRTGCAKSTLGPRVGQRVQLQLGRRSGEDCTPHTPAGCGWDDGRRRHLGIIPTVWILSLFCCSCLVQSSEIISCWVHQTHFFSMCCLNSLSVHPYINIH